MQHLQWLILPGEAKATYTNAGDNSPNDAFVLVAKVNADAQRNQGHRNWRLPTIEELKSLVGTEHAPATGFYWSCTPREQSFDIKEDLNFADGFVYGGDRYNSEHVRLVRTIHATKTHAANSAAAVQLDWNV